MRRSRWRLLSILLAVPVLVLVTATLYMLGMEHLEGQHRSFVDALEWAAETLTTTGYGHDAHWTHPAMLVLVMVAQFGGVFLLVMFIPFALIPYLEKRFEGRLPALLPRVKGAVLIYRHGPEVSSLQEALARARVPVVLLEDDVGAARRLRGQGRNVFHVDLEHDDPDLKNLEVMRAVVLNGEDHRNAVLALAARQRGYRGPILALVENPRRRNAMMLAGATATFTPNHVLAAAVAAQSSTKINPRVAGVHHLGRRLEVAELRVHRDSPLAGKSLAEAAVRARTGSTIVGWWAEGELATPPDPAAPIRPGTILIAAGSHDSVVRLGEITHPIRRDGHLIVAGHGEIGGRVADLLRDSGEDVRAIDVRSLERVDVVGDALDPAVLEKAGLGAARGVILCLPSDGAMLFAASIVRDLAPQANLIAAVRRAENTRRILRAGADFALSVSRVAGQILAAGILGEDSVSLERSIKVTGTKPGVLVGANPISARVRERTGCSIVAVERDDQLIVEFDEPFRLLASDAVYICGDADHVKRYFELIAGSRPA